MPAPVVIKLQVDGIAGVRRAFQSVEEIVVRAGTATERAETRSSRARVITAEHEAREKSRLHERETRARIASLKVWDREVAANAAKEVRETEKAETAKVRAVEKSARLFQQIQERSATLAGQYAKRQADTEIREAQRAAKEAEKFRKAVGGAGMQGMQTGARWAGGMVGTMMQLGGGFSVQDALQQRMALGKSAALLANSAVGVNGVTSKDVDPQKIMDRARAASIATGVDSNELVEATRSYVAKSSDFKGGMENMEFFGKVAKATGTKTSDVTDTMGILRSQNNGLDAEQAKKMLLAAVMQGKQGSMEFDELARGGGAGKIARTSTSFAGDQSANQQELMGLAQIGKRTRGSAPAAAISLSAIASDTRNHQAAVSGKLGYSVLDKGGAITKSPQELIADIMEKTGGNLAALGQHGGLGYTKPAVQMFEALKPEFDKAKASFLETHKGDEKGGNAAGRAASIKEMGAITGQTMKESDIDDMLKRVLATPEEQFAAVMRSANDAVSKDLLPALVSLIPELTKLVPYIADAANAFAKFASYAAINPMKGIGAVIAAGITAELVKSGIKGALEKALGSSLGNAGLIIGSALVAIEVGKVLIDEVVKNENRTIDQAGKDQNEAVWLSQRMKSGNATEAEIKRAKQLSSDLGGDAEAVAENQAHPSAAKTAAYGYMSTVDAMSGGNSAEVAKYDDKQNSDRTIAQLEASMKMLQKDVAAAVIAGLKDGIAKGGAGVNPAAQSAPMASPVRGGPTGSH